MNLTLPESELAAVVRPLLDRVAGELAAQLLQLSAGMAQDRANGLMDKEEAARYLKIEVRALEDWMKPAHEERGRGLPYFKLRSTVRFSRARIDVWALTHEENVPAPSLHFASAA